MHSCFRAGSQRWYTVLEMRQVPQSGKLSRERALQVYFPVHSRVHKKPHLAGYGVRLSRASRNCLRFASPAEATWRPAARRACAQWHVCSDLQGLRRLVAADGLLGTHARKPARPWAFLPLGDLRRGGSHRRTTSCGGGKTRPESLPTHGPDASRGSLSSPQSAVWTSRELFETRRALPGRAGGAPEGSRGRSGSARGDPGELFGALLGGPGSPWALFLELFRWQKSVQKRKW